MRLLCDVNVWIALLDDDHVFNDRARAVFSRRSLKIATCPLVENGVVRVLNAPRYRGAGPVGFAPVRDKLVQICAAHDQAFWPDDISLRDAGTFDFNFLLGHNQLTDAYLLALAVKHGGSLATFDQAVARAAVPGAKQHQLTVL